YEILNQSIIALVIAVALVRISQHKTSAVAVKIEKRWTLLSGSQVRRQEQNRVRLHTIGRCDFHRLGSDMFGGGKFRRQRRANDSPLTAVIRENSYRDGLLRPRLQRGDILSGAGDREHCFNQRTLRDLFGASAGHRHAPEVPPVLIAKI